MGVPTVVMGGITTLRFKRTSLNSNVGQDKTAGTLTSRNHHLERGGIDHCQRDKHKPWPWKKRIYGMPREPYAEQQEQAVSDERVLDEPSQNSVRRAAGESSHRAGEHDRQRSAERQ